MSLAPDLNSLISTRLDPSSRRLLRSAGRLADRRGWKIYLVGGSVRDLLLGIKNFDLDLLVEKHGLEFARRWAGAERGFYKPYKRFATAMVIMPGGLKVDITTTRSESYLQPGSLPEVLPGSLEEDLRRRDFTINALACSLNQADFGRLIDLCGGREDLSRRIIRVLHPRSFRDDPTRIFRAVRFQQRLDFTIEPRTEDWIRKAVDLKMFEEVSPERLRRELELILQEPRPVQAIEAMARYDELRFIHPRLTFTEEVKDSLRRLESDCAFFQDSIAQPAGLRWRIYLGALIWFLSPSALREVGRKFNLAQNFLRQLRTAQAGESELSALLTDPREISPSRIYQSLRPYQPEILLILLSRISSPRARDRVRRYLITWSKTRTKIGGKELKKLGAEPGPLFKDILEKILLAELDGRVKTRADELALARALIDRGNNA